MQLGTSLGSFTRPTIECGRILYDREACYGFFKIGRWQQEGQWDHGTLSSGDQYDRTNEKDHSGGTGVKSSSKNSDRANKNRVGDTPRDTAVRSSMTVSHEVSSIPVVEDPS